MKVDRPSRTAQGIAAARARESSKPEGVRLFNDPYARHFLGRRARALARIPPVMRLLRRRNARILPGMFGALVIRTRYIDDLVLRSLREGTRQVVILGAGYDSRACRLEDMKRGVRVFEVDQPETQRQKMGILRRVLGQLPGHVAFVPVRFQDGDLSQRLDQAGYRPDLTTFFIWEGVSMYLEAGDVEATLAFIARRSAPGSSVVFDYFPPSVARGTCSLPEARTLTRMVGRFGEEIRFGLEAGAMPDFLTRQGLRLLQDVAARECALLYFTKADSALPVSGLFRFAWAEVTG